MSRPRRSPVAVATERESNRLRPLFLAYCGERSVVSVAKILGMHPDRTQDWCGGKNLEPKAQEVVRAALGDHGGAP